VLRPDRYLLAVTDQTLDTVTARTRPLLEAAGAMPHAALDGALT
jgi:hypothetical protein